MQASNNATTRPGQRPMLAIEQLCTHYGAICAVDHVSLHVNQGEIVSLTRILAEQTARTFESVALTMRSARERLTDLRNKISNNERLEDLLDDVLRNTDQVRKLSAEAEHE